MTTANMVTVKETENVVVDSKTFDRDMVVGWLEYNSDKSAATTKTYSKAIGYFIRWLADNGVQNPQRADIINYREHLSATKAVATARLYTTAVKTMFKWLASQGLYLNVAADVKTPSLEEAGEVHRREAVTLTEAREVLSSFNGKKDEKSLRDALIMRLLLNCGLRSIELVRLDATDIEKRHGKIYLRIWGKARSGKVQRVEISKSVYNQILQYLDVRGSKSVKGEPMFTSTAHRNFGKRLQTQSISKLAKATFRAVGIDSPNVVCHSCRHFAVTELLRAGVDMERVRRFARHKSAVTTAVYRHDIDEKTDNTALILSDLLDLRRDFD